MPKNDFLSRQKEREHAAFEGGIRVGRQQMCDFLTLALRDPEAMGEESAIPHSVLCRQTA
nr:MAG TPA: Dihydroneopterin aldolase [Caudoviricetes sp.]